MSLQSLSNISGFILINKNISLIGVTPLMLSVLYNHPIITEYFHKCGLSDTKNAFHQTSSIDIENYLKLNMSSAKGKFFN